MAVPGPDDTSPAPAVGRRGVVLRLARVLARRSGIVRLARSGLELLARRANLHLVAGMHAAYQPLSYRLYARNTSLRTQLDLVRFGVLELLCRRVTERDVPGSVAEVGVAEGHWARVVNSHLPDRALYLFDTFAGFDERDLRAQEAVSLPTAVPYALPSVTPAQVLERLPHPERAVIRAGRFPDTAAGLEAERFCLVGIDLGLHEPTRAALEWFHPRLSPGGYLLVADYGNSHTPGVKIAVDEFVQQVHAPLVPLIDKPATAVIPAVP